MNFKWKFWLDILQLSVLFNMYSTLRKFVFIIQSISQYYSKYDIHFERYSPVSFPSNIIRWKYHPSTTVRTFQGYHCPGLADWNRCGREPGISKIGNSVSKSKPVHHSSGICTFTRITTTDSYTESMEGTEMLPHAWMNTHHVIVFIQWKLSSLEKICFCDGLTSVIIDSSSNQSRENSSRVHY